MTTTRPASAPTDARRVALLLGLLFGLASTGSSAVAVALPALAGDLGISIGPSAWVISGYALTLAIATAVYGRVADLAGIRAPLAVGVGLMASGALVAAFARRSRCSSPAGCSRAPTPPPSPCSASPSSA